MNILNILNENLVSFGLDVEDKEDAIKKIAKMFYDEKIISSVDEYIDGIKHREEEMKTGIGNGLAIPHCISKTVNKTSFALIKLNNYIEWGSFDDKPINYIIMLAVPKDSQSEHLKLLSTLSGKLIDEEYQDKLKNAKTIEDIKTVLV